MKMMTLGMPIMFFFIMYNMTAGVLDIPEHHHHRAAAAVQFFHS
jgi:hypothetical protein